MFDDIRDDLDHVRDVATRDFRAPKGKLLKWTLAFTGLAILCFVLGLNFFGFGFLIIATPYAIVLFRRLRRDAHNRAIGNAIEVQPARIAQPAPTKTSTGGGLKVPPPLSRDQ